jgi:hypothetical protein
MREDAPRSLTVGDAPCDGCGKPVQVKASVSGYLCYTCKEDQGGCGSQRFARSEVSNGHVARLIVKWRKPEYRAFYLDGAADDEPPEDVPEDEPEPAQAVPPAPRRPAPPAPRRPAPPAPKRSGPVAQCKTCGTYGEKGTSCHGCGEKV